MEEIIYIIEDQRGLLKNLLKTFERFEGKTNESKTRGYAQCIVESIDAMYQQFIETHNQILNFIRDNSISSEDVPYLNEDVYDQFQDVYQTLKGKLLDCLAESQQNHSPIFHSSTFNASTSRQNATIHGEARLPKIDIPNFAGDYLTWISFRDMFMSLVHNNVSLSKIQKYYFLKNSCTGTPLDIVNEYPASEENYELAWNALNHRYHNRRKIVNTLLSKLFSIPQSNGSAGSIQTILDTTRNCLALLKTLGVTNETYDAIIIYLTVQRLDIQQRKEWEQSLKASVEIPTITELFSFLETSFRTLESIADPVQTASRTKVQSNVKNNFRKSVHLSTSNIDANCPCCHKRHLLYKCFKFISMPLQEKRELIKTNKICHNCLNIGHFSRECRLASRCQRCQEKHHTTIHNIFSTSETITQTSNTPDTVQCQENIAINCSLLSRPQILLATMQVKVKLFNNIFSLKAILDPCAQASLITENIIQTLRLKTFKTFAQISGVGKSKSVTTRKYVDLVLHSNSETDFELKCCALVIPTITLYQPTSVEKYELPSFKEFKLADPEFIKPGEIDLLLGGDVYGDIILPEQRKFKGSLLLQLTHFGWVVSGPTSKLDNNNVVSVNICSLEKQLKAFWLQEEHVERRQLTKEEEDCEAYFKTTTTRDSSGRYTVSLPFKSVIKGNSYPIFNMTDYSALSRLKHIKMKCEQNRTFGDAYYSFMHEYENLNHMKKVGFYPKDLQRNCYFLPHHGVWKESSSTTKMRVVFDASFKIRTQNSLNDELAAGPALQNDIATTITRWRRFKVGFRSDLEKMFRQINVISDHQKYQQILWRNDSKNEINIYKLATVTYGTASAPFLSMRVLHQLAKDEEVNYPLASKVLISDTYVDDIISGADNFKDAIYLQQQLCKLLMAGGFTLRKWISNSKELMNSIPEDLRDIKEVFEIDETDSVKALGLKWNIHSDSFSFNINFGMKNEVTKKLILSDTAKLYDPLGWLSPTIITAKIMLQKLWLLGVDWNDPLPQNLVAEWQKYIKTLKALESIKLPRWIGLSKTKSLELHGFCDASSSAFAAVVYAKITDSKGDSVINILQSKTKVSPLKRLSIPRLELNGAALLVKLINKIKPAFEITIDNVFYWTDSTTVLCWIRGQSTKWTVYVGNRVAEIQRISDPKQWNYIASYDNPADCASRGIPTSELVKHNLWWTGPKWLKEGKHSWPAQPTLNFDTKEEISKSITSINTLHTTTTGEKQYSFLFQRYSSLDKLQRITALLLRFYNNIMVQKQRKQYQAITNCKMTGFLNSCELEKSFVTLIKISQVIDFSDEMQELQRYGRLSVNNHVARLCPFIDSNNILRVGGRLENSKLAYYSKHPILLKKQNPLSVLILKDAHIKTLHGSLLQMQSFVARRFWILYSRNLAKQVIRCCIKCFKYNAKASQQMMGNLPSVRLTPTRPFKHSGVDYAGPITIKQSTSRNSVTAKGYICLFICMVTKALHLEAVTSLSTDSFIAAFKRFISRRGMCTDLYSDCGTNFVGASKELQILYNRNKSSLPENLLQKLATDGTKWHFIPPATPNFGGLWEAGVKSTKYHLKRLLDTKVVTYEELSTLLAQIESCLNSRPLCALNNDPSDANALTPSHFLIGEATSCLPSEDLIDCNLDRLTRWKAVEKLKQHFWQRWQNEWLSRMQSRPKWLKPIKNARQGDLVLVLDERCLPGTWPLARVKEVHPGTDGIIRVVTLTSKNKTFKRPISKIAFLPSDEDYEKLYHNVLCGGKCYENT